MRMLAPLPLRSPGLSRVPCLRYRSVAERMLGAQLAHSRDEMSRILSLVFLNRQLVWRELSDLLLFVLPLLHSLKDRHEPACGAHVSRCSRMHCPVQLFVTGLYGHLADWQRRLRGVRVVRPSACAAMHGGALRTWRLLLLPHSSVQRQCAARVLCVFDACSGRAPCIARGAHERTADDTM